MLIDDPPVPKQRHLPCLDNSVHVRIATMGLMWLHNKQPAEAAEAFPVVFSLL